jgi:hypothetical protein
MLVAPQPPGINATGTTTASTCQHPPPYLEATGLSCGACVCGHDPAAPAAQRYAGGRGGTAAAPSCADSATTAPTDKQASAHHPAKNHLLPCPYGKCLVPSRSYLLASTASAAVFSTGAQPGKRLEGGACTPRRKAHNCRTAPCMVRAGRARALRTRPWCARTRPACGRCA